MYSVDHNYIINFFKKYYPARVRNSNIYPSIIILEKAERKSNEKYVKLRRQGEITYWLGFKNLLTQFKFRHHRVLRSGKIQSTFVCTLLCKDTLFLERTFSTYILEHALHFAEYLCLDNVKLTLIIMTLP